MSVAIMVCVINIHGAVAPKDFKALTVLNGFVLLDLRGVIKQQLLMLLTIWPNVRIGDFVIDQQENVIV